MNRRAGVLLSYVLMAFEVLSTLLLTPFIIRTLGQAEYGVYKLAAAINGYLLLLDLGVGNAVTRYISKYRATGDRAQERKFLGVATLYYLLIAVIVIIAGTVLVAVFPKAFAKGLSADEAALGQKLLSITMFNSAITLGTAAYPNILIAYERFVISRGVSIAQIIMRMLITYAVLKMGMGSVGIVSVNLFMTLLCRGFFIGYAVFRIKLVPSFKRIELTFIKEIAAYSSWILLQMIATMLNSTVDQVLIGSLVASSAVILAVYGVGTQIVQYFQSIGSAFTGVLMPGVVRMVENKASPAELTNEMIRVGRIIFMALGLIWGGFLVCGREFVILWAGEDNEKAHIVAIILMTAYLFTLTEAIGTQILWARNEHKEQAVMKIVVVVLNIFLTAALIKWNPLIGATIGTFISLMAGDVGVMNIIFAKKLKLDLVHYYRGIMKGIVPCIVLSIAAGVCMIRLIKGGWFALIAHISVMCMVYAVTMLLFGMNQYEKNLCSSMINKFIKR